MQSVNTSVSKPKSLFRNRFKRNETEDLPRPTGVQSNYFQYDSANPIGGDSNYFQYDGNNAAPGYFQYDAETLAVDQVRTQQSQPSSQSTMARGRYSSE